MSDPDRRRPSVASLTEHRSQLPSDLREQQSARQIAARPTYTEIQLEEVYKIRLDEEEKRKHKKNVIKSRKAGKTVEVKSPGAVALGILTKVFPVLKIFINYRVKEYAVYDLLSGISVGLFIIPQAIAFSLLANLKPQFGFYSAFFAMLIYFIFGTSNHINMSSQGAVSLLVGEAVRAGVEQVYPNSVGICSQQNETVTTFAPDINGTLATDFTTAMLTTTSMNLTEPGTTVVPGSCIPRDVANTQVSITITMVAGAAQLLMGFCRFGFLTIYLSDPLNSAFTCGAALHILSSQLANMLGATFPPITGMGKFFLYFVEAGTQIIAGKVNTATILVFILSFALLLTVKLINERCTKYVKIPIPIDIIVLVLSLLLSQFLFWEERLKIDTVGAIERGFSNPQAPPVSHFTSGSGIIVNGLVLGIISYSLSVSLAKTFAVRYGYEVDANQEMIAYGAVNFGMSWFSTFVSASSIACTSLHESMRGKTLLYSLYAVIITLIGILTFGPIFSPVPKCVLSGIILVNLKNMMLQFDQLPGLWRTNRYDFAIWVVTLGTILGLDLPIGLLIGVIFSLATVIFRTQAPKAYLLGRVPQTDIYKNVKKIKGIEEIEGVRVFKFDGALYFASAENFRRRLFRQVAMNPKKILAKAKAHAKLKGQTDGNLDIRTEVVDKQEIKNVLDTVRAEGSHPNETARQQAQASTDELNASSNWSVQQNYDDDRDDDNEPTVNVFCIIFDMSACAFTDAVGIRLLKQIVDDFNKIGVEIYLSGCSSLLRSQLRKGSFFAKRSEEGGLFITVHDAVIHALSTLYQELVEDENDSVSESGNSESGAAAFNIGDEIRTVPAPHLSRHHANKKLSAVSTGSDEGARELRRQARKVSRQQSQTEDFAGTSTSGAGANRKISQRVRSEHPDSIQPISEEVQQQQLQQQQEQTTPIKNRYQPDAAKPLPVFDDGHSAGQAPVGMQVADVVVHEDEESRRDREELETNLDEMLKSLPNPEDHETEGGHDNDGFENSEL